ncbi:SDR family NAD(P)-dependent oxidoreductase [Pararhodospirillum oryzae]|uniref:3-hydroxyacyl-CoA dehydrogenase n=1 Tax=Pararhodospirillum oryzae TaxID=478448 RepID=A0A512H951_9PROT|nr:SDR family NAD(P)-dependent oxidoreductase [Pararhodospirillum oryzae]GEO81938.1 3-hydroxyacyl-CoA dehydrogenase [Pararhodospirillum oryzae]
MHVNGSVAVVTGAASGLGRATAAALVDAGARVALLDRAGDTVKETAAALGPRALGLVCDVCDEASVTAALDQAAAVHGPARLVVNAAGIFSAGRLVGRDGPIDLDSFRRTIEVNLMGTVTVMSRAAARMTALEPMTPDGARGVIVNTASIAAFEGQTGQGAYAASKGAVAALTLPAARELARHGIRVVAIAPGVFETPMVSAGLTPEVRQGLEAACVFPARLGHADEFARFVVAVCQNPMLNGSVIRLDGAQRLG